MRSIYLIGIGVLSISLCRAEIFDLPKSTSPDGKYFLTIDTDSETVMESDGRLQIRDPGSRKVLGTFNWSQYDHISASTIDVNVLWKEDSQAFAVPDESGVHWTDCHVYASDGAKWLELDLPRFKPQWKSSDGWQDRGKGGYIAREWLKDNTLRMDYFDEIYRFNKDGQMEVMPAYRVYVHLTRDTTGPCLKISRIEKQASEDK